jgi:hypothetical protein
MLHLNGDGFISWEVLSGMTLTNFNVRTVQANHSARDANEK